MKVFVTGASGFLGKRLVTRLIKEQYQVTALARSSRAKQVLAPLGIQIIPGSLSDIELWKSNLQNQDIVIHCAAPVEFWGPWDKFYQEITLATKQLAIAAADMGVKRFIYISSESVLQNIKPLVNIDESFPYPPEPNSYYGKAKQLAEKELLYLPVEMEIIIIRPTYIWGKGNKSIATIEEKIKSGQFKWIDQGKCLIETVHVANVVEAIFLACTKGKNKNIYLVTDDDPITIRDYLEQIFAIKNIKLPKGNLPGYIAKFLANLIEFIWKLFKINSPPPLSRFDVSFVALPRKYNIDKIKIELGYKPVFTRTMGLQELKNSSRF